jgi:flagellar hook assembly protein FlgD
MPALMNGDFSFTSQTISPDADGYEDVLQVNYQLSEPGLLGTFTIYDDRGREVKVLFSNELLGSEGTFTWDGTTGDQVKASIGSYFCVFEAFALDGGLIYTKRKVFVVAGKL